MSGMRVINLFGGPGTGKSTNATGVFSILKKAGVNCEYVHEEAKEFTWEDRSKTLECQPYIFAKQMRNLWRLKDQVELAICDSPLLLSGIYGTSEWPEAFYEYVLQQFDQFDNWNIFLDRGYRDYNPKGRNQTYEEAIEIDNKIKSYLDCMGIDYMILNTEGADGIIAQSYLQAGEPKYYTLEQIKDAFWAEFEGAGELFFDYMGTKEEIDKSVEEHWRGFAGKFE